MGGPASKPEASRGRSSQDAILYDAQRGVFPFGESGRYEMKATYRDMPEVPNAVLDSNAVVIEMLPPKEKAAWEMLSRSRSVAILSQWDSAIPIGVDSAMVEEAADFLAKHGTSPYAEHLKPRLWNVLQKRIRKGDATPKEREIYDTLRSSLEPIED